MRAGVVGELPDAAALLDAVRELRRRGHRDLDAFTPYPVEGLDEALDLPRSPLNWRTMPLGALGALVGYFLQLWCNGVDYPLNVGGRPLNSAPAFIPITFETGVLFAAVFGVLWGLWLTRLPRLYLPLFDAEGFERATLDRFFVGIDAREPGFSRARAEQDLAEIGATRVMVARDREEP
jgi:hypothetical protein